MRHFQSTWLADILSLKGCVDGWRCIEGQYRRGGGAAGGGTGGGQDGSPAPADAGPAQFALSPVAHGFGNVAVVTPSAPEAFVIPIVSGAASGLLSVGLDGAGWSWGENSGGQLGDGSNARRVVPVQAGGLASAAHSVALTGDGTVWTWGKSTEGQLGDPAVVTRRATPGRVPTLTQGTTVSAGARRTVTLRLDVTGWTWGVNAEDQLGDRTTTDHATPTNVPPVSATAVPAGARVGFRSPPFDVLTAGRAELDAPCSASKPSAYRGRTFQAHVTTTTEAAAGAWCRPDGALIGTAQALQSSALEAGVWQLHTGDSVAVAALAWMGATSPTALGTRLHGCENWTDSTSTALRGRVTSPGADGFSAGVVASCGSADARVMGLERRRRPPVSPLRGGLFGSDNDPQLHAVARELRALGSDDVLLRDDGDHP